MQEAPDQKVLLSPDPHPHWTIKECLEQPEAIFRALAFGGRLSDGKVKVSELDEIHIYTIYTKAQIN